MHCANANGLDSSKVLLRSLLLLQRQKRLFFCIIMEGAISLGNDARKTPQIYTQFTLLRNLEVKLHH